MPRATVSRIRPYTAGDPTSGRNSTFPRSPGDDRERHMGASPHSEQPHYRTRRDYHQRTPSSEGAIAIYAVRHNYAASGVGIDQQAVSRRQGFYAGVAECRSTGHSENPTRIEQMASILGRSLRHRQSDLLKNMRTHAKARHTRCPLQTHGQRHPVIENRHPHYHKPTRGSW